MKTHRRIKSNSSTNMVNLSLLMISNMAEIIFTIISKKPSSHFLQLQFSILYAKFFNVFRSVTKMAILFSVTH